MGLKSGAVPSLFGEECNMIVVEGQPGRNCIKIVLPRRINSQRLFSREQDFQKTEQDLLRFSFPGRPIFTQLHPVIGAPNEDETESKFVPSMPTTTSNSVTQTVLKKEAAGAPKPYPCQICCENLNSLDEVYEHLQKSHGYADKVYLCRLCHYTSPNRSLWFSHYSRCQRYETI